MEKYYAIVGFSRYTHKVRISKDEYERLKDLEIRTIDLIADGISTTTGRIRIDVDKVLFIQLTKG